MQRCNLVSSDHPDGESVKVINIEPFQFDNRLFSRR